MKLHFIDTTAYDDKTQIIQNALKGMHGIIVPGGYGARGAEGMIRCVQYAREHRIPYLGLCLGFQLATVEFARHICNLEKAASTEFDVETPEPVISLLPDQESISDMGGTQRLGGHDVKVQPGSKAHAIYGAEMVRERFRHRYEFNNLYKDTLEEAGMVFSGTTPDQRIMQILEYPPHPFFVATQFHPGMAVAAAQAPSAVPGICPRCGAASSHVAAGARNRDADQRAGGGAAAPSG